MSRSNKVREFIRSVWYQSVKVMQHVLQIIIN